jgi:hypothetical protein
MVLGGGAVTAVSRVVVVVVVVSGWLAQETSIIARIESIEVRMIDFFIVWIVSSQTIRHKLLRQMY